MSRLIYARACAVALLCASATLAVLTSTAADWSDPLLAVLLLAAAVVADRFEVQSSTKMRVVGSFPAFVLAAVLLGPAPAAAIGAASSLLGPRKHPDYVLGDVAIYSAFPLLTALAAQGAWKALDASPGSVAWGLVVVAAFLLAGFLAYAMVAAFMSLRDGRGFLAQLRTTYVPLVSTHLANGVLCGAVAISFEHVGIVAVVAAVVVLASYTNLQHRFMAAEADAQAARAKSEELLKTQMATVRAIIDSVHARDQMTARHSAAVARYSQRLAAAYGCSEEDQLLVHTAALLHDIGKFIFPDRILFADRRLDDEDWQIVKRHPAKGAEIVGRMPGYEEIADVILSHHERWDGGGYPRGLAAYDIPLLSRMISIADTYDVMTSRDSYRDPVTPSSAVAELRRVAGSQLDAELVEVFVEDVLADDPLSFRHVDDSDLEAELRRQRRTLVPAA